MPFLYALEGFGNHRNNGVQLKHCPLSRVDRTMFSEAIDMTHEADGNGKAATKRSKRALAGSVVQTGQAELM